MGGNFNLSKLGTFFLCGGRTFAAMGNLIARVDSMHQIGPEIGVLILVANRIIGGEEGIGGILKFSRIWDALGRWERTGDVIDKGGHNSIQQIEKTQKYSSTEF